MLQCEIAGFRLRLLLPDWAVDNRFFTFRRDFDAYDMLIQGGFQDAPVFPDNPPRVRLPGRNIFIGGEGTGMFHTPEDCVTYIGLDSCYSRCLMALNPSFDKREDPGFRASVIDAVSASVRTVMSGKLALNGGLNLHASVIKWRSRAVLFSAPSGTGKSTHAHLWKQLHPDAEILNGDNAFFRFVEYSPFVYGAPWCGTSNEFLDDMAPVAAVVFLEQGPTNQMERLSETEAAIRLSARSFLPFWDNSLVDKSLDTAERAASSVPCWLLRCRPDHDAVRLVEKCIGI